MSGPMFNVHPLEWKIFTATVRKRTETGAAMGGGVEGVNILLALIFAIRVGSVL